MGAGNLCYCHGHKLGGEEKGFAVFKIVVSVVL